MALALVKRVRDQFGYDAPIAIETGAMLYDMLYGNQWKKEVSIPLWLIFGALPNWRAFL